MTVSTRSASTYSGAVRAFIRSAPWLGPEDMPALATLRSLAKALDNGPVQAALVGQFGLTYRALLKRAPGADSLAEDPLEATLRDAGA